MTVYCTQRCAIFVSQIHFLIPSNFSSGCSKFFDIFLASIGLFQKFQLHFFNDSENTPEYMLPSFSTKAGVGLVKCAANVVVGSGAWVGNTLSRVLLRRQPNGTEKVNTYLSPIQVSLFSISEYY